MIEKILERLEETRWTTNFDAQCLFENAKLDKCIEIVKEVAAEYNNGWIPCSSGKLPKEYEDVEVTVEEIANDVGGKRYYTMRSWMQDGQWVIKKNPYHPTVIAWKEPSEPYHPKGE